MLRKLTTLLFILFIAAQCTVQKRLYNKGYSVSWNRKFQKENECVKDEVFNQSDIESKNGSVTDSLDASFSSQTDLLAGEEAEQPVIVAYSVTDTEKSLVNAADTVYVDAVYVPSGIASFAALAGAGVSLGLGVFSIYWIFFLVAIALLLVSFVLGIISVIQFKRKRKAYIYNSFGVIALVCDVFALGVIGVLALFLILF